MDTYKQALEDMDCWNVLDPPKYTKIRHTLYNFNNLRDSNADISK